MYFFVYTIKITAPLSVWSIILTYNISGNFSFRYSPIGKKCTFQNSCIKISHCPFQFRNFKIVYRRYAGLYFCICVDVSDNNLAYLEAIHNFVEVLNEYFHNVCELDLVFNFYKVWIVSIKTKFKTANSFILNKFLLLLMRTQYLHGFTLSSCFVFFFKHFFYDFINIT